MNISRYSLLFLLTIANISAHALTSENADTLVREPAVVPFVRLGVDVSSIARSLVEPEVQQFELSIDSELIRNWFFTLEGGISRVNSQQEDFTYNSQGYFFKAGADYNLLGRPHALQNDLVILGLRYAYGGLSHEAPEFFIANPYWGDTTDELAPGNYHQQWIEFVGGVKTELFKNLFLSWTLRTRVRLNDWGNTELEPYYIGGFGHGRRKAPLVVQYSVLYRFGL